MGVRISREPGGKVSVAVSAGSQVQAAIISSVEARLLAIKLLLAAEDLEPSTLNG